MRLRRSFVVAGIVAGTAAVTLGAQAATRWRPFATGTDTSEYYVSADASGDVTSPKALAIQGTHSRKRPVDVTWYLSCQGEVKGAPSGRLLVVAVETAKKCSLDGSASADSSGSVRVVLLKK